jgi:hypothetical protein
MAHIVLLSCTKSKLDKPAQAQDLYSPSPTFRKTLEYGKSLKPDKMYILSAKHYLVPLTKKLAPYDLTLKDMKKEEKEKWGEKVIQQMKSADINLNKDKITFLTGTEYMKPLIKYIPSSNINTPLEGKRMGERMKWLNNQIKKIQETFKTIKNLIYEYLTR